MPGSAGRVPLRAAVLASVLAAACGADDPGLVDSLGAERLRRLTLGRGPQPAQALLVVSRYEVTEAEFGQPPTRSGAHDLPAVGVSIGEAQEWCAARGLRLPTVAEWQWLASGGEPTLYPWRSKFDPWSANTLELGLHRPLPVGTFESGRNVLGAYDFSGNVWEWAMGTPYGRDGTPIGSSAACGGSFASDQFAAQVLSVRGLEAGERAEDIGFRPVAAAPQYFLSEVEPLWRAASPRERAGMVAAFEAWQSDLRAALADRLAAEGADGELCSALREARAP